MTDKTVLRRKLAPTDLKYGLLGLDKDLRDHFPDRRRYFVMMLDTGKEFRTCVDNTNIRLRAGSSYFHDWYNHHGLEKGDTIYIEVVEPLKRYRLSVRLDENAKVVADSMPVERRRRQRVGDTARLPSLEIPYEKPLRKRGRPTRSGSAVAASSNNLHAILDSQIKSIRDFLQGRTTDRPSDEKLCDWVYFCYTFELFSEAIQLFSLVVPDSMNSWYFNRTKKLAAICQVRARQANG